MTHALVKTAGSIVAEHSFPKRWSTAKQGLARRGLAGAMSTIFIVAPITYALAHSVPADSTGSQATVEAPEPEAAEAAALGPNTPPQVQTVVNRFKLWRTGTTLPACFLNGDQDLRAFFVQTSHTWLDRGGLQIDFGASPSYRSCRGTDDRALRVAFGYQKGGGAWDNGNWSNVGTDANIAPAGPTINIGYAANTKLDQLDRRELRRLILHEAGHALGLEHEHQSPLERCEFDWAKVVPYYQSHYGWAEAMTRFNLDRLKPVPGLMASPPDRDSIMNYAFAAWEFVQKAGQNCEIRESYEPSATDLTNYAALYPGGPVQGPTGVAAAPDSQNIKEAQQQQEREVAALGARALEALQVLLPDESQRQRAADLLGTTAQRQFTNFQINLQDRSVKVGGNQANARDIRGGNAVGGDQKIGGNQANVGSASFSTGAPCSPATVGAGGNVTNNNNCTTNSTSIGTQNNVTGIQNNINGTQNNVQGSQFNNPNNVNQFNNNGTINNQGGINLGTPAR